MFPVLFLFARNVAITEPRKVILPFLVVVACAVVVTTVAAVALRDARKGAIAGAGLMLLALSYGHVWTTIQGKTVGGVVVGRDMVLIPLWIIGGVAVVVFASRVRSLPEITGILNAAALALVALAVFNIASGLAGRSGEPVESRPGERSEPIPVASGKTTRDIYYLIFDRYAGPSELEEHFDFDNEPFLDELRDRGFYVADRSVANYPDTTHSMASSLNIEYLDALADKVGSLSTDLRPLHQRIVNPKIARFLKRQGYRYAHAGPWFDPTAHDPTAHVNYHYDKRSEFTQVLLDTTVLQAVGKHVDFLEDLDGRHVPHNQILFQFDAIRSASQLEGPTFTLAHFLLPHEPYTFDAQGNFVTREQELEKSFEEAYVGQVEFANAQIRKLVDDLIDVGERERPIIVIQADEGPKRLEWTYGGEKAWTEATDSQLRLKSSILNAYYLPGIDDPGLYRSITPVNSFRKIFNLYFDTKLALLPDRSYAFGTSKQPYVLTDISSRLGTLDPTRRTP